MTLLSLAISALYLPQPRTHTTDDVISPHPALVSLHLTNRPRTPPPRPLAPRPRAYIGRCRRRPSRRHARGCPVTTIHPSHRQAPGPIISPSPQAHLHLPPLFRPTHTKTHPAFSASISASSACRLAISSVSSCPLHNPSTTATSHQHQHDPSSPLPLTTNTATLRYPLHPLACVPHRSLSVSRLPLHPRTDGLDLLVQPRHLVEQGHLPRLGAATSPPTHHRSQPRARPPPSSSSSLPHDAPLQLLVECCALLLPWHQHPEGSTAGREVRGPDHHRHDVPPQLQSPSMTTALRCCQWPPTSSLRSASAGSDSSQTCVQASLKSDSHC